MAQESGFFNATKQGSVFDREYDAADFARYFSLFIGDGVFINPATQLQVVQKTGLTVTVKAGAAFIEGYWFFLTEDEDVSISPNGTAYAVNTNVCVTLNKSTRNIQLKVRNAVSSVLPVNNGTEHDLVLATIEVGVGASQITDAVITDRRPYPQYCGYVSGLVETIDASELFTQFTSQFNSWFDGIKGQLEGDAATKLAGKISELEERMDAFPEIRYGASVPSNSTGKDGDVYIRILDES